MNQKNNMEMTLLDWAIVAVLVFVVATSIRLDYLAIAGGPAAPKDTSAETEVAQVYQGGKIQVYTQADTGHVETTGALVAKHLPELSVSIVASGLQGMALRMTIEDLTRRLRETELLLAECRDPERIERAEPVEEPEDTL